jgi:predicted dehydrogenase
MYSDIPLVTAEGGWVMADGYGLEMQYRVNFERATARFTFDGTNNLTLFQQGKTPANIPLSSNMGYIHEIEYFLDCISSNRTPSRVTFRDAAHVILIIEAEGQSILSGQAVELGKN